MRADNAQHQFSQALAEGDLDSIVNLLQDNVLDIDSADVNHDLETPLMRLCHADAVNHSQMAAVLEIAQSKSPNMDKQDAVGRTLAMHACISQNQPVVTFLTSQLYDVMLADRTGNNVMHYAATGGNEAIVKQLLTHPDMARALQVLNYHGYSPIDLARQKKCQAVVRILAAFMRPPPARNVQSQDQMSFKQNGQNTDSHGLTTRQDSMAGSGVASSVPYSRLQHEQFSHCQDTQHDVPRQVPESLLAGNGETNRTELRRVGAIYSLNQSVDGNAPNGDSTNLSDTKHSGDKENALPTPAIFLSRTNLAQPSRSIDTNRNLLTTDYAFGQVRQTSMATELTPPTKPTHSLTPYNGVREELYFQPIHPSPMVIPIVSPRRLNPVVSQGRPALSLDWLSPSIESVTREQDSLTRAMTNHLQSETSGQENDRHGPDNQSSNVLTSQTRGTLQQNGLNDTNTGVDLSPPISLDRRSQPLNAQKMPWLSQPARLRVTTHNSPNSPRKLVHDTNIRNNYAEHSRTNPSHNATVPELKPQRIQEICAGSNNSRDVDSKPVAAVRPAVNFHSSLSRSPRHRHLLEKRHASHDGVSSSRTAATGARDIEDVDATEFEEELSLETPRDGSSFSSGRKNQNGAQDKREPHLRQRSPSISLPDLRDMTGCLVLSPDIPTEAFAMNKSPRKTLAEVDPSYSNKAEEPKSNENKSVSLDTSQNVRKHDTIDETTSRDKNEHAFSNVRTQIRRAIENKKIMFKGDNRQNKIATETVKNKAKTDNTRGRKKTVSFESAAGVTSYDDDFDEQDDKAQMDGDSDSVDEYSFDGDSSDDGKVEKNDANQDLPMDRSLPCIQVPRYSLK
ncbi:uncharacterized protein LOC106011027 [Aplysia californica]|uniref:Uncharacterized protein LOC106011027 n=1 Tax=Aplysia californica TaxID=6500 RepID=A0ABM1VNQ2_APLCA|nr:uncharacterized protein LOC106011027 [Aplysia californica]